MTMAVAYAPSLGVVFGEVLHDSRGPHWITVEDSPSVSYWFIPDTWIDDEESE
jgi:hypothetical protein